MYNGVGLPTPRGSGTSGYIQRNLGALPPRRLDLKPTSGGPSGPPRRSPFGSLGGDKELLEHERKRRIEVKLLDLKEEWEAQGVEGDELERRVDEERQRLLKTETLEIGKKVTETHLQAQAKQEEDRRLRAAFGIDGPAARPGGNKLFSSRGGERPRDSGTREDLREGAGDHGPRRDREDRERQEAGRRYGTREIGRGDDHREEFDRRGPREGRWRDDEDRRVKREGRGGFRRRSRSPPHADERREQRISSRHRSPSPDWRQQRSGDAEIEDDRSGKEMKDPRQRPSVSCRAEDTRLIMEEPPATSLPLVKNKHLVRRESEPEPCRRGNGLESKGEAEDEDLEEGETKEDDPAAGLERDQRRGSSTHHKRPHSSAIDDDRGDRERPWWKVARRDRQRGSRDEFRGDRDETRLRRRRGGRRRSRSPRRDYNEPREQGRSRYPADENGGCEADENHATERHHGDYIDYGRQPHQGNEDEGKSSPHRGGSEGSYEQGGMTRRFGDTQRGSGLRRGHRNRSATVRRDHSPPLRSPPEPSRHISSVRRVSISSDDELQTVKVNNPASSSAGAADRHRSTGVRSSSPPEVVDIADEDH